MGIITIYHNISILFRKFIVLPARRDLQIHCAHHRRIGCTVIRTTDFEHDSADRAARLFFASASSIPPMPWHRISGENRTFVISPSSMDKYIPGYILRSYYSSATRKTVFGRLSESTNPDNSMAVKRSFFPVHLPVLHLLPAWL